MVYLIFFAQNERFRRQQFFDIFRKWLQKHKHVLSQLHPQSHYTSRPKTHFLEKKTLKFWAFFVRCKIFEKTTFWIIFLMVYLIFFAQNERFRRQQFFLIFSENDCKSINMFWVKCIGNHIIPQDQKHVFWKEKKTLKFWAFFVRCKIFEKTTFWIFWWCTWSFLPKMNGFVGSNFFDIFRKWWQKRPSTPSKNPKCRFLEYFTANFEYFRKNLKSRHNVEYFSILQIGARHIMI